MRKTVDNDQKQFNIDTALDYRLAGLSYRAVAKKMGVNVKSAYTYVQAGIKIIQEEYREKASALVTMELAKLDKLEIALYKGAIEGDTKAINSLLRIQERRSRLLGLDAAVKQHVAMETLNIKIGGVPDNLQE